MDTMKLYADLMEVKQHLQDVSHLLDVAKYQVETLQAELDKKRDIALDDANRVGWIALQNEKPFDGELVVIDTGKCKPYMLTYFEGCNIQFDRFLRLPD